MAWRMKVVTGLWLAAGSTAVVAADTTPPLVATAPNVEHVRPHAATLSWPATSDASGIKGYGILRNGNLAGKTTGTRYTDTGLQPATTYSYTLIAEDKAGNRSLPSPPRTLQTPPPDSIAPTTPSALTVGSITSASISLSWAASTDASGVRGYGIVSGGKKIGETKGLSFKVTGLLPATGYSFKVIAEDNEGNRSAFSSTVTATTLAEIPGPPAITGASLVNGKLTVNGHNFGVKPVAGPLRYEDFDSRTPGAPPADFGYHNYGGFGGTVKVDASEAYSGAQSLRHQANLTAAGPEVQESFPHIAVRGFSSQQLYLSYRLKFNTHGSRIIQLKFNRSAMEVPDAAGSPCYGGAPKFRESYYPEAPSNASLTDKTLRYVQGGIVRDDGSIDEGWIGETPGYEGSPLPIPENTWVQVEAYYKLNDIGTPNGEYETWVNGHRHFNRHQLQVRSAANQLLNCSYLAIGVDYYVNAGSTDGVTVWYDDHYLDTSRARLVLADAASWEQSTLRNPQPASAWNNGQISAQLKRAGFAPGSDGWLFVVAADGSVSGGWKIGL